MGAETRSVIPFALELATKMDEANGTAHTNTVLKCASALLNFYLSMEIDPFDPCFTRDSCHDFAVFYEALQCEALEHGRDDILAHKA